MTRTLLEKCEISVSPEERTFLQLAASMTGLSLSAFIRKATISAAKDAIDKNNHYLLSGNDVRQLPAFFYSLPRGSLKTATVA